MNNKPKLPILGQPIFIITENSLDKKVAISGTVGVLNSLTYFAADAIQVLKLEYADDSMERVIINRDMVNEENPDQKLEFIIDLKNNKGDLTTKFIDEREAQDVAKQMNINQQKQCKKLVDMITHAYHEYDNVIAACTVNPVK